jgi:hypothetical protein
VKVDPELASLRAELSQLKGTVAQRIAAEQHQAHSRLVNDIESFAATKNPAGEAAYPFFDHVIADMVSLALAERTAGRMPKLQDLYERAVWANPETRQKQLAASAEAERKRAASEAKAKAAAARKAGSSVTGAPSPGQASPSRSFGSVREAIEAAFDAA